MLSWVGGLHFWNAINVFFTVRGVLVSQKRRKGLLEVPALALRYVASYIVVTVAAFTWMRMQRYSVPE